MREFEILELDAGYYLCRKGAGYCRIIVDENSQNLPLGKLMLNAEDISDRYLHQNKATVFRLIQPFQDPNIQIYTLMTKQYNIFTYKRCIQLGGKWEPILKEWVFSSLMKDKVDKLNDIINSEKIYIEALFEETVSQINKPLTLYGFPLIKNSDQKGHVILHFGIKLAAGEIARFNSGSQEKSVILAGSKIKMFVPKSMLEDSFFQEDYLCIVNVKKARKPRKNKSLR